MPLQTLYPAEILPNDIRAQGFAFQGLVVGLASFINTYATPIALERIGWKTCTIFRELCSQLRQITTCGHSLH